MLAWLSKQITNNVVTNQSANATLALGASPIMATSPQEMEDLSKVTGALLINFGTIQDINGMLEAGMGGRNIPIKGVSVLTGVMLHRTTGEHQPSTCGVRSRRRWCNDVPTEICKW